MTIKCSEEYAGPDTTQDDWDRVDQILQGNIPPPKNYREKMLELAAEEGMKKHSDPINPSHYKGTTIEAIEYMESIASHEEFRGYLWLTTIKYLHRWQRKGGSEDLLKAEWFLNRLTDHETGGE